MRMRRIASASRRKKVRAVFKAGLSVGIDEPEPGLVHERRGLERVAGLLARHLRGGEAPKFGIDQRKQLVGGGRLALLNPGEKPRDVVHARRALTAPRAEPALRHGAR